MCFIVLPLRVRMRSSAVWNVAVEPAVFPRQPQPARPFAFNAVHVQKTNVWVTASVNPSPAR